VFPVSLGNYISLRHSFLTASGDWVSFIDPIGAEVIGNIENFHVGEAESMQLPIRGPDIRTLIPRAAPTVDDEEPTPLESLHAIPECLESRILAASTNILRSGDMCLGVEDMRTNLQHQGFLADGRAQHLNEFLRLQQLCRRNRLVWPQTLKQFAMNGLLAALATCHKT
jgi:hypothetical protein